MSRLRLPDVTLAAAAGLALAVEWLLGAPAAILPVMIALIALFGMPHGALDVVLARRLWPIRSSVRLALFLALYLGLAAAILAVWTVLPTPALILFLCYSAWHFSEDWATGHGRAGALAGGALVLALPALAAPEEVAALFSALGADGVPVARGLALAAAVAGPVFAVAARRHGRALARMACLVLCALVLSPLGYFFVFFCGLHSVRHMRDVTGALDLGWAGALRHMLWPGLATLALLLVAGWILAQRAVPLDAMLMQVVFIAFAALTVPHMLLVDRFHHGGPDRAARRRD